ncbi:MAG: hypothetical protein EA357_10105 [Micavibrio sp.]|nr:MAG: hypothetical protein EA357_10105 [Micavibrio sp.]
MANDNQKNPSGLTIFIDLDGVLSDFDSHAKAEGKIKPDGKTDYDALDHLWWQSMPVYEGAREFYTELKKIGETKFLTAPMASPESHYGKAKWITDFDTARGKWMLMDMIICPSRDKHYLSGPDRILIDDRIENVRDWEKSGGIGVHHKGDFKETLKALDLALKKDQVRKREKMLRRNFGR